MTMMFDRMSARARAADACDYSGSLPLVIEAAPAARTPGSGQKASSTTMETATPTMATPAPASKPDTSTETKAPKARNERTAAIAKARAAGKRGKGKPISRQELLDYIIKIRAEQPGSAKSTESSYAWWVLKYAFSSPLWNELWALAERGVTKVPDAPAKASSTAGEPAKAAPARVTGKVAKRTPGEKARAAAGKPEPKAATGAKAPAANKRAAAKRTRKATAAKATGEKQVTTNFKAGK